MPKSLILNDLTEKMNNTLIGTWISNTQDKMTSESVGNVAMTFTEDGNLLYDVYDGGNLQRINMIYKVDGDTIISDQPSHPQEQKTKFFIENNDQLILHFEGERTLFSRLIC